MNDDGSPIGEKWSFDHENRKCIPKNMEAPEILAIDYQDDIFVKHKNHISNHISDNISNHISNQISDNISNNISNHISNQISDNISKKNSNHISIKIMKKVIMIPDLKFVKKCQKLTH